MAEKSPDKTSLDDLKGLLLEPEQNQIRHITTRLDDPMIRADEISNTLPDAISLSVRRSDRLARVIQPVIDSSLKSSVRNNPKAIADAIFPALGPGIRKAIASTIMGMVQSLNQVLNHSFSLNGLKWRFEAFKTGKSFAEVVMLNTLVYQTEQVFLIHKNTGIVLEHVVAKDAIIQDPDLVSGMLTAIQDFVTDSFSTDTEEDLETLRIGSDRSVWIEKGEHALVAAVLRGTPPLDLRLQYRELIEEIHLKSGSALEQFNGDPSPFSIFRESLKDGLRSKIKSDTNETSPLLWILFAALFGSLCFFGYTSYQTHRIRTGFLERLSAHKGIVVMTAKTRGNILYVTGLKDPVTVDPESLLTKEEKRRFSFSGRWEPYYCLDPDMVLKRARIILKPPDTLTLSLSNHTLLVTGTADHQWIEMLQKNAAGLPGVDRIDTKDLISTDHAQLAKVIKLLSGFRFYFKNNRSELVEGQEQDLSRALNTILDLQAIQKQIRVDFQIVLFGHTDSSGSEKLNLKLSRNRAEKIFNYFLVNGVNPASITLSGIGTQMPLTEETSMDDRQFNRAVSFKIFYSDSLKGR